MRSLSSRSSLFLLAAALLLAMAACDSTTVYHHYEHVEAPGWEHHDTVFFAIPPSRLSAVLHEEVELRTTSEYPYRDLCLVVHQTTFPSLRQRTDTLRCSMADEFGNIKGRGIGVYQYHFHLTDLSLSEGDSVVLAIRHNMRTETLRGITDIGVRLSKK